MSAGLLYLHLSRLGPPLGETAAFPPTYTPQISISVLSPKPQRQPKSLPLTLNFYCNPIAQP